MYKTKITNRMILDLIGKHYCLTFDSIKKFIDGRLTDKYLQRYKLKRLIQKGFIETKKGIDKRKRIYSLTDQGMGYINKPGKAPTFGMNELTHNQLVVKTLVNVLKERNLPLQTDSYVSERELRGMDQEYDPYKKHMSSERSRNAYPDFLIYEQDQQIWYEVENSRSSNAEYRNYFGQCYNLQADNKLKEIVMYFVPYVYETFMSAVKDQKILFPPFVTVKMIDYDGNEIKDNKKE